MALSTVEEAIAAYRMGQCVIIVDDEERENEGDLAIAAQWVTPEAINFMATHGRGLICVAMTGDRLDALQIPLMVPENTSKFGTAFCVSVEARDYVTTGISAADRAATIRRLIDPTAGPSDFIRPGHTFPLRAREGGVLVRAGQTEASVDLARLAGLYPAGVICEIMNSDGTMARRQQLGEIARQFNLKMISVAQLIEYRRRREKLVRRLSSAALPTPHGEFQAIAFEDVICHDQHVALTMGDLNGDDPILVRMHSECLTGDVFGSLRCDCGEQLQRAMALIAEEGRGVIVYLRGQEGRGIGLHNKFRAYELQDRGLDTVEANERLGFPPDLRHYGIGAQILVDLGVRRMRLLTNNLQKVAALDGYGIEEVERIPLIIEPNEHNRRYLETKQAKLGHVLGLSKVEEK
ncbi:MAG TPA: bifunctional 3,4-dihydroxy-2-butanone-4-phosphate synthase/GTP cyclohydrolase II [Chloroflexota bacterium]|nr:bifunctional 3,4-dihydroxy-2-butanone-4-phosphate synthase/GTP cyclohydrolase II [Chloroflexota bacterium]